MAFGKRVSAPLGAALKVAVAAQHAKGGEQRHASRKTQRLPGLIFPGGIAASIPCTIADQSITGACLMMQDGWANPFQGVSSIGQTFRLVMRLDKMEVDCEIVRLEENEMGVRFISPSRPIAQRN